MTTFTDTRCRHTDSSPPSQSLPNVAYLVGTVSAESPHLSKSYHPHRLTAHRLAQCHFHVRCPTWRKLNFQAVCGLHVKNANSVCSPIVCSSVRVDYSEGGQQHHKEEQFLPFRASLDQGDWFTWVSVSFQLQEAFTSRRWTVSSSARCSTVVPSRKRASDWDEEHLVKRFSSTLSSEQLCSAVSHVSLQSSILCFMSGVGWFSQAHSRICAWPIWV